MTAYRARPPILPDPGQRMLVVEASAGTGKTFFLEHRTVDLLLRTGATIDQLLVVTFTEKATAELRARIRGLIAELAILPDGPAPAGATADNTWTIDDAARKKLRDALTGFDRAPIHTIHGFCQRLLVEDAFAGRRLFDQSQVPDEAAFAEAFHLALRERFAVDPVESALLGAYLDSGSTVAKLRDTLLSCARRGAPVTPTLDPIRLVAAADRFCAAFAALPLHAGEPSITIQAALGTGNATTRRSIATRILAIAEALATVPPGEVEIRAIALSSALSGEPVEQAAWIVDRLDKIAGAKPTGVALLEAVAELGAAHVPIAAVCASRFLPAVVERVRASKSRRGQFDFQDMLRLVWDVLGGDRGDELVARLRTRHPWAMIDEFQDTDELQWDIFRRVWAEGDATSLAIVGDPKQAIYSFRGADVQTYLKARDELAGRGALVLPLAENFRSSKDVVDAVNALVGNAHGKFFTGRIRYDAPVRAANGVAVTEPDGATPSPVHIYEMVNPADRKAKIGEAGDTLAERMADEIERLLDDDPGRRLQLRDRKGQVAALAPHDIFVLTRSGRQSDQMAQALRARGVPCALYQREHLFDADEALEVADLLDAIADPRDRSARLRAWTSSFFAVPLAELGELAEVPDAHPLLALLHDWRGLAVRKDYDVLFHRILDDTRWVERTLVAGAGERAVTNVLHLFELLHDEIARARCEIHELAATLRGWIRTGGVDRPDDVDIQRLETDRQAVQIMTIHRAKGLEAAVVFLFGGHIPPPGGDDARLYHDEDGRRLLHVGRAHGRTTELIETDIVEENQRLMYVALTRAKVRLYLPVLSDFTLPRLSALNSMHHCLLTALGAGKTDDESRRLFTSERVSVGSLAPPDPVDTAEELRGWAPPVLPAEVAPPGPTWDELRTARGGVIVTSYSKLRLAAARASDADDVRGEEHSVGLVLDDGELPGGAGTGLFLHQVLEHVRFGSALDTADPLVWAASAEVAPVMAAAARRHGVDLHRFGSRAATYLHNTLTRPATLSDRSLPALAGAKQVAKEVEFAFPLALADGREAFARGFIDLLVAWDDQLWVVDYKSDLLDGAEAAVARKHVADHYQQQAELYAVAAARLLALRDGDDCRRRFGGVLYWFVRYGWVVDLPVTWPDLDRWTTSLAETVAQAEARQEPARSGASSAKREDRGSSHDEAATR